MQVYGRKENTVISLTHCSCPNTYNITITSVSSSKTGHGQVIFVCEITRVFPPHSVVFITVTCMALTCISGVTSTDSTVLLSSTPVVHLVLPSVLPVSHLDHTGRVGRYQGFFTLPLKYQPFLRY